MENMGKAKTLFLALLILVVIGGSTGVIWYADQVDSFTNVQGEEGSSVTAFGKIVAQDVRTQIDIASSYPFNPERLRLFLNGEREFYQYGDYDVDKFKEEADAYSLRPGPGDSMVIETAESATYVVGSEMSGSFAFHVNKTLENPGDYVRVGAFDGRNGWYMEYNGNHSSPRFVDLYYVRDGERHVLKEDVELERPLTEWNRYEIKFNWYNVGHQRWVQTYTDDGEQFNDVFAKTSIDGERGPSTPNLNIHYNVKADQDTTGLELDVGSMGYSIASSAQQLVRGKVQRIQVDIPTQDNVWHPVYALKLVDNTTVNARLNELEVSRYTNNGAIELIATSVDPSKTDAHNFTIPSYQHRYNTQLRDTFQVTTVPAANGTVVDPSSTDFMFGGWTVSAASLEPSGQTFQSGASTEAQTTVKRPLLEEDVIVFMARTTSGGGELTFDYVAELDY